MRTSTLLQTMILLTFALHSSSELRADTPSAGSPANERGYQVTVAQTSGGLNEDAIRDTANRVMQQHDYRSVRRRVLENVESDTVESQGFLMDALTAIGDAFGNFFEWLFSGLFQPPNTAPGPKNSSPTGASSGGSFGLGQVLLYLAFAAVILVAIWLIATVFKMTDGSRPLNSSGLLGDDEDLTNLSTPPGELAASTYESRAIKMAAAGNHRGAIRELLVGSMSWIERAGLIRYRKGLTNRDYVRAVWRQQERRDAYLATSLEFERVYFGRREATAEMFESCLYSFRGSFREEETTATV